MFLEIDLLEINAQIIFFFNCTRLKVNVINICLNTSYPAGIYHFLVSLLLTLNTCQTRVSTESGKSRKSGRVREYQGRSENSMDVREKSGNFIISCDKKENDSFWEQLLVLKMYLLITSCLSFQKKKITSKETFFQDFWLIDPAFNSWLEKVNNGLTIFQCKF